jgi:hypothetical protein
VLFAQLWGVGGVHILTFTVIPTPFMRTSRRVGAGLGAHFERSLNMPRVGASSGCQGKEEFAACGILSLALSSLLGTKDQMDCVSLA